MVRDVDAWIPVVVALIGAGGPVTVMITRFDRRNSEQHAEAIKRQERTLAEVTLARGDISRLQRRFDRHLEYHSDARL